MSKKLNINEIASLLVGGARQGRVGHEMNDKKKVWQVQEIRDLGNNQVWTLHSHCRLSFRRYEIGVRTASNKFHKINN